MLLADDIPSLVTQVVAQIDQIDCLNAMQNAAFTAAGTIFTWRNRGIELLQAVNAVRFAQVLSS